VRTLNEVPGAAAGQTIEGVSLIDAMGFGVGAPSTCQLPAPPVVDAAGRPVPTAPSGSFVLDNLLVPVTDNGMTVVTV